jgi:hypothetical protein
MKKILLYRLAAIAFLCLSSLLIKSENSMCGLRCASISKTLMSQQILISDTNESPFYHDDGFFIKI